MNLANAWKAWLLSHPSADGYNTNLSALQEMVVEDTAEEAFKNLAENKPIILLTKGLSKRIIQSSFNHSTYGNKILGEDVVYLAITGFGEEAIPVSLDIQQTFKSNTSKLKMPSMENFLKIKEKKDIDELKADTAAEATNIPQCAVVPPFLAKELLNLESLDIHEVILAFAKAIKELDDKVTEDNPKPSSHCTNLMQFLWSVHKDKIKPNNPFELCNNESKFTDWYKEQCRICLKSETNNSNDAENNISPDVGIAISSLADSMAVDREERLANEAKKEETKGLKAWDKLNAKIKTIILRASSTVTETPTEPVESLHEILQCKGGAATQLELQLKNMGENMNLSVGLCTSLNKGLILSNPTPHHINNLSPLFTPPSHSTSSIDYGHDNNNQNLLESAVQASDGNGLARDEVIKQTKQTILVPRNIHDLRQHVKNFAFVLGEYFGKESVFKNKYSDFVDFIKENETEIIQGFKQEGYPVTIMNQLHVRGQRFLVSCGSANDEVDFSELNMKDLKDAIRNGTLVIQQPDWAASLTSKENGKRNSEAVCIFKQWESCV